MQPTSAPQVLLFGHKAHLSQLQVLFSMQTRGVVLKNGVPYLQMGLSTLAWHVSRRPEEQRTSFSQSIPRRFSSLASRHSTSGFFACKTQISPSICINGLPYHKTESLDIVCAPERSAKMWTRVAIYQCPAGFLIWPQSAPKPASGAFFQCKWEGWA